MSPSVREIGLDGLDSLTDVDSLCLFVPEDQRPLRGTAGFADWRLCGALSRVLLQGFFAGALEDCLLLPSGGRLPPERVFAVGIGRMQRLSGEALAQALAAAARILARAGVRGVALEIPGAGVLEDSVRARALVNHFLPHFKGGRVVVLAPKGFEQHLPGGTRGSEK